MYGLPKARWHRKTKSFVSRDISSPFDFVHIGHESPRNSTHLLDSTSFSSLNSPLISAAKAAASAAKTATKENTSTTVDDDDDVDEEIQSITSEEERADVMSAATSCGNLTSQDSCTSLGSGSTIRDKDLKQLITETVRNELEPLHRSIRTLLQCQGHKSPNRWSCPGRNHADTFSSGLGDTNACISVLAESSQCWDVTAADREDSGEGGQLVQPNYSRQNSNIPPLPQSHRNKQQRRNKSPKPLTFVKGKHILPLLSQHSNSYHSDDQLPHLKICKSENDIPPLPTPHLKKPLSDGDIRPIQSPPLRVSNDQEVTTTWGFPNANSQSCLPASPPLLNVPTVNPDIPPIPPSHKSPRMSYVKQLSRYSISEGVNTPADDRECLASALQANIEKLLESDVQSDKVLGDMYNENLITEDEYQHLSAQIGRCQQLRLALSLIKGRDLDILNSFSSILEKYSVDFVTSVKAKCEEYIDKRMKISACTLCKMRQSVNIKYVIDKFWAEHLIPDGFYNEVVVISNPTGVQDKQWKKLIEVINKTGVTDSAFSILLGSLQDRHHYRHLAEGLEKQWNKSTYRLVCTCLEGKGKKMEIPAADSGDAGVGRNSTYNRGSCDSILCGDSIAEELEWRLTAIEHESRSRHSSISRKTSA